MAPSSGEPTSCLERCEDDTILTGGGTPAVPQAGRLIFLLAAKGQGLPGKIVLMTASLQVAEDLGSGGGSDHCSIYTGPRLVFPSQRPRGLNSKDVRET